MGITKRYYESFYNGECFSNLDSGIKLSFSCFQGKHLNTTHLSCPIMLKNNNVYGRKHSSVVKSTQQSIQHLAHNNHICKERRPRDRQAFFKWRGVKFQRAIVGIYYMTVTMLYKVSATYFFQWPESMFHYIQGKSLTEENPKPKETRVLICIQSAKT